MNKTPYALMLLIAAGLLFQTVSTSILAQTSPATGSATTSDTDSTDSAELDEQVRESMLERVRNVAAREQVQGALVDLLSEKGGYIGEITRISEEAITVSTRNGSVIVPLSEDVTLLEDDEIIAVDSIEVGNWATVMGDRLETQIEPEFVIISEESLQPRNQRIVVGSIFEISRTLLIVTARDGGSEMSFVIDTDSVFQDQDGSEASWQDFDADFAVLISAVEDAETQGQFNALTVRSLANLSEIGQDAGDE